MNGETITENPAAAHEFTVLLSPTRRGARLARLLTVAQLGSWGFPDERAGQVVAELAANAVLHGRVPGRDFRLGLTVRDGTLRIEVTDTRAERMPATNGGATAPLAETGRGLLLVAVLADRWGVRTGPTPRKTVWAELALPTS
ncbi:ATP-binding protein [Streptomyces sp. JJ38]|uniref:ATP-binding protein n=1 Tax=Streptomyces sp. JJ38 TaxID=2738128 RepID=UPI001C58C094|nr:ATP-binding protein [Streptomyces sp. JJ38]MBW1597796.1 ATP-binding protein [Streptomyces sp. JJ38]